MLWGECRAQPSSPYKDDGEMLWVGNVVHNLLPHIKMMARCCGYDGEMLWVWECRAQPSSPYKDDGEMLWVGNVVHNLLPHIKMMARCCGCKLIGGDELCMKK
ncbi:C-Jun-amino-terminal kinase-interacting 4-like [Schistosoma japonicum]|nr:C-Jun-amino-terminal kinase-interacting 4-like [Schistosoma japonicum]